MIFFFLGAKVRQICHVALKQDHEFVNCVQEGSDETHQKVKVCSLSSFEKSCLPYNIVSHALFGSRDLVSIRVFKKFGSVLVRFFDSRLGSVTMLGFSCLFYLPGHTNVHDSITG